MMATIAAAMLLANAPADGVAALGWMAGSWATESEGRWTEEQWTSPRGGIMLGVSRTGKGDSLVEWEFIRIAPDDRGVPVYWGAPGGRPAIGFRLSGSGPGHATFENLQHDFPKQVSYRREGDVMTATISGANGANPRSWIYRRR